MHRVSLTCLPYSDTNSDTLAQGKHGSDTEVYTTVGDFDEDKFLYIFDMYSSDPHTHITFSQGVRMLHGNMNPFDPVRLSRALWYITKLMSQFGWIASIFEWLTTYILLYPLDKRGMAKADVKAVYNVSVAAIWASYFQPSHGLLRARCFTIFLDGLPSPRPASVFLCTTFVP